MTACFPHWPSCRRPRRFFAVLVAASMLASFAAGRDAWGAEFYVVNHGWHSGIVIPRAAIPSGAWPPGVAERDFAGCRYLELGWGDRKFYMAKHPGVLMALDAAFLSNLSALHIVGYAGPLSRAHNWDAVVTVPCTREELEELCRALGASFAREGEGRAQALGRGLYGYKSQFYAARGRYWIGNTCNTWTLRIERAGGLPTLIGPGGTLKSGAVIAQTRRLVSQRR